MLMKYLARSDTGAQKYFDRRLAAKSWAQREEARWVKVYLFFGKCPLVAHYQRNGFKYSSLPVIGTGECLYPEREQYHNQNLRRFQLLEWKRPGPDWLTQSEMAALHGVAVGYVSRLALSGKLKYVVSKDTRFFQKDQIMPPPTYKHSRKEAVWALNYDECIQCGGQDSKHRGRGICYRCSSREYRKAKKEKNL